MFIIKFPRIKFATNFNGADQGVSDTNSLELYRIRFESDVPTTKKKSE